MDNLSKKINEDAKKIADAFNGGLHIPGLINTGISVPFIQTISGPCVAYCLANLFNDDSFLKHGDWPKGMNNYQANQLMDKHQPEYFIDYDIRLPEIPDEYLAYYDYEKPCEDGHLVPMIWSVKSQTNPSLIHAVLCLADQNKRIYLVDSRRPQVYVGSVFEIKRSYGFLQSVEFFRFKSDNKAAAFSKEYLDHLRK